VKVAVCIHCFNFVTFADREAGFGSAAGFKGLALVAELGLKGDPLDVMDVSHRMLYAANGYKYLSVLYFVYGYMFFVGCFNSTGDDFFHGFSAAHYRYSGAFNYSHDLAAVFALIKF